MTLPEAITRHIVTPGTVDGYAVWLCKTCGQYLCWYLGKLHFTCTCHDRELAEA